MTVSGSWFLLFCFFFDTPPLRFLHKVSHSNLGTSFSLFFCGVFSSPLCSAMKSFLLHSFAITLCFRKRMFRAISYRVARFPAQLLPATISASPVRRLLALLHLDSKPPNRKRSRLGCHSQGVTITILACFTQVSHVHNASLLLCTTLSLSHELLVLRNALSSSLNKFFMFSAVFFQ